MEVLWRLRSPISERLTECRIVDHSMTSFELRIVQLPQGVTKSSTSFRDHTSAACVGSVLGAALRGDGCVDEPATLPGSPLSPTVEPPSPAIRCQHCQSVDVVQTQQLVDRVFYLCFACGESFEHSASSAQS